MCVNSNKENDKTLTKSSSSSSSWWWGSSWSSSSSLLDTVQSYLGDVALTVNCVANIPMYSMMSWIIIYYGSIYMAPSVWAKSLLLAYTPYTLLDATPRRGLRWLPYDTVERFRSCSYLKSVAQYFPVHLHKTIDLDPAQQPYLFLYHPHGVIGMGCNAALSTNGCGFNELFPGIKRWGVTLNVSFLTPIFREWMLALGYLSANKETLTKKLATDKESIVLMPGGAAEALHAHGSNFRLQLKHRKGFVKIAIRTGAALVPCLGFGENNAFHTYYANVDCGGGGGGGGGDDSSIEEKDSMDSEDDTQQEQQQTCSISSSADYSRCCRSPRQLDQWIFSWQTRLYKVFSFSFPIITWPIPQRSPIHVVVGPPVRFKPDADVDVSHEAYLQAITDLYNANKHKYGHEHIPIEIV